MASGGSNVMVHVCALALKAGECPLPNIRRCNMSEQDVVWLHCGHSDIWLLSGGNVCISRADRMLITCLNWCTRVQMHYPVRYGMKFVSLLNIIDTKCPPRILSITHPRQPFVHRSLSGVQLDCTTDHRAACSSHLRHV